MVQRGNRIVEGNFKETAEIHILDGAENRILDFCSVQTFRHAETGNLLCRLLVASSQSCLVLIIRSGCPPSNSQGGQEFYIFDELSRKRTQCNINEVGITLLRCFFFFKIQRIDRLGLKHIYSTVAN